MNPQNKKTDPSQDDFVRISDELARDLNSAGYKSATVSVERLRELKEDIRQRNHTGQFAPHFFAERLESFDFEITVSNPEVRSIIIVAAAQPHARLEIMLKSGPLNVIVPPTYSTRIDGEVERLLKKKLEPSGHQIFRHSLPLKSLAVRSGLARYGRNNLAYVEGMGSYCRLLAFCTSFPVRDTIWMDPLTLEDCEKCSACINKCPTDAIDRDRFLIRAERCLTFHNERKAEFSGDLQPQWHHCLVGCLYCQAYCPVNKKVGGSVEDYGRLDEHDTAVLVNGGPPDDLSECGKRILDDFDFTEALPELSRNLRVLVNTPGNTNRAAKLLPRTGGGKRTGSV